MAGLCESYWNRWVAVVCSCLDYATSCQWFETWTTAWTKAPSTIIGFQTKTEPLYSGYSYYPHYNAENDHRKWSHSKTLSRVEWFENDALSKCWYLVWTEKTMLSENGDVIKIDTTGCETTRPRVSKMVDTRYHVASRSHQFYGPIYKCACIEFICACALRV